VLGVLVLPFALPGLLIPASILDVYLSMVIQNMLPCIAGGFLAFGLLDLIMSYISKVLPFEQNSPSSYKNEKINGKNLIIVLKL
jgi:hypothetical protein